MPLAFHQGPLIRVTVAVNGRRRRGERRTYLFSQTFSVAGSADELQAREFAARLYEALRQRTAELLALPDPQLVQRGEPVASQDGELPDLGGVTVPDDAVVRDDQHVRRLARQDEAVARDRVHAREIRKAR
jgi:hypothetical protein